VASQVFIPLTVGGAVNTLRDFDRVLKCGADKVSVNSGAIHNPALIGEGAKRYGSQCVVLSRDVKRAAGEYRVFARGGRDDTGLNALDWAARGEGNGAGELVVNSMDTDGVKNGFDLPLLEAVAARVSIPVIASGGAGDMRHFAELFKLPGIDAGLAASIFHYRQLAIPDLKVFLAREGIPMRIAEAPGRDSGPG
jgi:cyclase